jgi:hypothetical protein
VGEAGIVSETTQESSSGFSVLTHLICSSDKIRRIQGGMAIDSFVLQVDAFFCDLCWGVL